jgi:hypothetical protein
MVEHYVSDLLPGARVSDPQAIGVLQVCGPDFSSQRSGHRGGVDEGAMAIALVIWGSPWSTSMFEIPSAHPRSVRCVPIRSAVFSSSRSPSTPLVRLFLTREETQCREPLFRDGAKRISPAAQGRSIETARRHYARLFARPEGPCMRGKNRSGAGTDGAFGVRPLQARDHHACSAWVHEIRDSFRGRGYAFAKFAPGE